MHVTMAAYKFAAVTLDFYAASMQVNLEWSTYMRGDLYVSMYSTYL